MGILLPGVPGLRAMAGVALLALAPAAVSAPVYQWKDASGQTVYSDQPPPAGVSAEQMKLAAPPSAADVEASQQRTKAMQQQTEQLNAERQLRAQRAAAAAKQTEAEQAQEPEEEPEHNTYSDPQTYYPDRQPISRPRPPRGDLPLQPAQPIVNPGRPGR